MAEAEYVARLVAHLRGKSNVHPNQLHSNFVSKPDGAQSLYEVLRQHPDIFSLHYAAGSPHTVSLVAEQTPEAAYVARLVAICVASRR